MEGGEGAGGYAELLLPEIWVYVLSFVAASSNFMDVCRCGLVSKDWRDLVAQSVGSIRFSPNVSPDQVLPPLSWFKCLREINFGGCTRIS